MPPQPWILVTPSSQGIGLALTRRLLNTTRLPVVATARTDIQSTKKQILEGLDINEHRLEVLKVDVTDEQTVANAAEHCKDRFQGSYLRLALAIPGILHPERSPAQIDYAKSLEMFKVNTLGPLLLMKYFCPFLPRKMTDLEAENGLPNHAVFAMMSARVGSITDNRAGGWYSYRSSKSAINQIAKSLDIYLRSIAGDKAMAMALHPGTVKTGLSRDFWETTPGEKLFSPLFSAEKLLDVIGGVSLKGRGKCWDWEGKEIPP